MEGLQRNKVTQVAQVLQVRNVRSQKGEGSSLVLNLEFTQVPVKGLSCLRLELHVMVPDVSELQCRQWHFLVFPRVSHFASLVDAACQHLDEVMHTVYRNDL